MVTVPPTHTECDYSKLHQHRVHSQLELTDSPGNDGADLVRPPLKADHEESRNAKLEEQAPLRQPLPAPPLPGQLVHAPEPDVGNEDDGRGDVRDNQ